MRWLFLLLIFAVVVNSATAEKPPSTYMGLKTKCKNMSVKEKKVAYIQKQLVAGVVTGAAIFAMNEYFIWTQNEAFHNVMPYVAMAYTLYQTTNILVGRSTGKKWDVSGDEGGFVIYLF